MVNIIDESECFEDDENDIIGYRIKKAKKRFEDLDKEDFITVTIHRPPEPDTLSDILRELKRELSKKSINKRCTEYILAELGYRTLYKYLSESGFQDMQDVTKKIRKTIGNRLVDRYPEMANFILSQRDNTVHTYFHISEQQHEQLQEIAYDLYIPIGDVLLMCIVCAFNDLNVRFDACSSSDLKYKKYCSTDGFLSVVMDHINEIAKKARLYIINSKPILELVIKEKECVICSGTQIPDSYREELREERKLMESIKKFLESDDNAAD